MSTIRDGKIHIPTVGKVRIRRGGENPYPNGVPKQARVTKHGKKWYVSVTCEIDEPVLVDSGVIAGIDRNASGMLGDGTPAEVVDHPTKKKRHHRQFSRQMDRQEKEGRAEMSGRAKKTLGHVNRWRGKRRNCRHNRNHQNSAKIAKKASTVKLENLKTGAMTRSARGTAENPGTNVRAKAGLNRVLLEGALGQLAQMLEYKCVAVFYVLAAYTSQTCSLCGHVDKNNRATLRKFVCLDCEYGEHADKNAAANILMASGRGASGCARGDPVGDPDDPSIKCMLEPS